ncbi:hypothetical protein BX666DRAFT_1915040 [Dichotomocladium elegans]|nr:hypothetical protein BX666DRAFT_1915040 [Dichotomocladium elegans]
MHTHRSTSNRLYACFFCLWDLCKLNDMQIALQNPGSVVYRRRGGRYVIGRVRHDGERLRKGEGKRLWVRNRWVNLTKKCGHCDCSVLPNLGIYLGRRSYSPTPFSYRFLFRASAHITHSPHLSISSTSENMSSDNSNNNPAISPGQSNSPQDSSSRSPSMVLSIKSLEHQTKPVTISRDASVLDLKLAVQGAFQIESNRQRLIFQGKMMKDGQNLTEYANLDTGKVVHLVVRPSGVQANPQNDEPRSQTTPNNRRTFSRGFPLSRFPFGNGLPMVEGYTFITLDVGDRTSPNLTSFMDGLAGSLNGTRGQDTMRSPTAPPPRSHDSSAATTATNNNNNTIPSNAATSANTSAAATSIGSPSRHQFEFHLNPRNSLDLGSNTTSAISSSELRSATNTQFPASVEVRLMRTMGCMRNVRTILDTPQDQSISGIATTSSTSPEQAREIRARLRSSGSSQTAAVGLVLDDLAALMTDVIPRLQELSEALRAGDGVANSDENMNLYRRVLRTARIIQGLSLINHFLGSVLAAADVSPRRSRTRMFNTNATSTNTTAAPTATTASAALSSLRLGQTSAATTRTDHATTSSADMESISSEATGEAGERRGIKRDNSELDNDTNDPGEGSSSQKKGKGRECSGADEDDGNPC